MAPISPLPLRLLANRNGKFEVIDTRNPAHAVNYFDIITYTWGPKVQPYDCGISGVAWNVPIRTEKLEDIKRLMEKNDIEYLWVDCVCLNQDDEKEKSFEIPKMYEYYKAARKCYILMEMDEVWEPQEIIDNLKFVDHVRANMRGASLASEAMLTDKLVKRLDAWAETDWKFPIDYSIVRSAAIDMGLLNCYSTCITRVVSLFENPYFSRVWTFQEMILGKNITMYGINAKSISCIGQLDTWMDLATDAQDKAVKLQGWIETSRVLKTATVNAILRIIEEDFLLLDGLQTQVRGISSARTDIINGGPHWWYENHKGISNIFSAISITPRTCEQRRDVFRGLLGIFNGLFTPEEVEKELTGDDIEKMSFAFFRQLSTKTGLAWTKLAISSTERGSYDWIPVIPNSSTILSTDCFAAVINLGRLKQKGMAKAIATTGIIGGPRKYMRISLNPRNQGFSFIFKGCNVGKKIKTGLFSSEAIPDYNQLRDVSGDETGRILVQCATVLGSILDPGGNVVQYRRRLLRKLLPYWKTSDPAAKPTLWQDRCVSGTDWENPHPCYFRVHNRSMNFRLGQMSGCGSRLENKSTENISCEVRVNCGCVVVAPFSLIMGALTAVEGCSLGQISGTLDGDRIVLKDGLGLVQVGDVGRAFSVVAFGGDVDAFRSYASGCRNIKDHKPVEPKLPWPRGRALVREEFSHGITDTMRDYGFVDSGGSGNLLICRNNPIGQYKILGVCLDDYIENKRQEYSSVTIR